MTNQHPNPITPPPELVEQWRTQPEFAEPGRSTGVSMTQSRLRDIAAQAAQWGADQELEACCEVLTDKCFNGQATLLREWRRPKPPSLKEQALTALHAIATGANDTREQHQDFDTIRRALEALDD